MKRGDKFIWSGVEVGGAVYVDVTRVARDGSWADVRCTTVVHRGDDRGTWTKRMPAPFPASFIPVRDGAS